MQCCTDFLPAIYIGLANFINFILFQGTFTLIIEAWHDTNETSSRSPGKYTAEKRNIILICTCESIH